VKFAPKCDAQGRTTADVLRARRCRRLAQERSVSFEEVLRDHLAEHRAFWADYVGTATIADIMRYARRNRAVLAEQEPT
jgi:hypothetical protein